MDFSRKVALFATRVGRIDKSAKAATGRNEIKMTKRIAWGAKPRGLKKKDLPRLTGYC
jgi:hypothetical protein